MSQLYKKTGCGVFLCIVLGIVPGSFGMLTLIALASPTTILLAPMLLGAALAANPPLAPPPQLDATGQLRRGR